MYEMRWLEKLFRLYYTREILEQKLRSARLYGLKTYIQAIQTIRLSAMAGVALVFATCVAALGAVALLAGIFLLLPLTSEQRLWTLVASGAVLFLVPLIAIRYAFREQLWMGVTGINHLLEEVPRMN